MNFYRKRKKQFKVGHDISTYKKNFEKYKPFIAPASFKMFWISIIITLSFIVSQIYLAIVR